MLKPLKPLTDMQTIIHDKPKAFENRLILAGAVLFLATCVILGVVIACVSF